MNQVYQVDIPPGLQHTPLKGTALLFPYREDAELGEQAVRDRAALPTTLEGFKKHPLYVLQRHIPRYSALAPDTKSVGLHR